MAKFPTNFLFGAATAAHQVEGNNTNSDFWAMEQLPHSNFNEPSLDAVDHYNHYEEDIKLLANAGLNAYRFSVEWARIEPQEGQFDENELAHYRKVLECCHANGVTPIVTLHHFSSPKWLIEKGGWEWDGLEEVFPRYCAYIAKELGDLMGYVCTINEANMGIQIAALSRSMMSKMGITPQIGMNFEQMIEAYLPESRKIQRKEIADAFGNPQSGVHDFLSMRTNEGDLLMQKAHIAARKAIKAVRPELKVGLTLSLFDLQVQAGGEQYAVKEWADDFSRYLPAIQDDDFLGVQNYTRKIFGENGGLGLPEGAEVTEMGFEFYPKSVSNVLRRVAKELPGKELIVTENGIATPDDSRRVAFLKEATDGVADCVAERVPVKGYCCWTLLDNFEWQMGYARHFGLIAVDRATQERKPKESLYELGKISKENK
jgi:beta-glucosidase